LKISSSSCVLKGSVEPLSRLNPVFKGDSLYSKTLYAVETIFPSYDMLILTNPASAIAGALHLNTPG
jgi:hypothetical protein